MTSRIHLACYTAVLLLYTASVHARYAPRNVEKDFEFMDNDLDEPYSLDTLQDDEDYQAQQPGSGFGPHPGFPGGGGTDIDGSGEDDQDPGTPPVYYRVSINFTSLGFSAELGDRNSLAFQQLARELTEAIESLFRNIPGKQVVTILQFRAGSTDPRASPSLIVTFDLGTVGYNDQLQLYNILNRAANSGQIAQYSVSPSGLAFRPLRGGGATPAPPGCGPGQFQCRDGACIPETSRCDQRADCGDLSDEDNCAGNRCGPFQWACRSGECINANNRCDGNYDCQDYSDETGCEVPVTCGAGEMTCNNGRCVDVRRRCDRRDDCGDGSDEQGCAVPTPSVCGEYEFQCLNGQCIDERRTCDGRADCLDASDELNCNSRTCSPFFFTCSNGRCISPQAKCDNRDDCGDGSDELDCAQLGCGPDEFECTDGACISQRQRCDGQIDCADFSDEQQCPPSACQYYETQCTSGECIDSRRVCDGYQDCRSGSDEAGCDDGPPVCADSEFACSDGSCISDRRRCDGYPDCPDLSDEYGCPTQAPPVCRQGEFQCNNGQCIPASRKCDRRYDCADRSDETTCEPEPTRCRPDQWTCGNGECIDQNQRCDRQYHCSDGTDELECDKRPQPQRCRDDQFTCSTTGQCIEGTQRCDGQYDCNDFTDEQNCQEPQRCRQGQFECTSGECIDERRRCDGKPDCRDQSDERTCGEPQRCRQGQFQCSSGECIDEGLKCDGRPDCRDQSDEINCPPVGVCQSYEFRCDSGQCIDSRLRCDGRYDCQDASDEFNCQSPITVTVSPTQLRVREGEEAVFQCRASGSPTPNVRWTKANQGLPFGASDVNGRLTIRSVSPSDAGEYACSAIGVPGNYRASAQLIVDPRIGPTEGPIIPGRCGRDEATCQNGQCVPRDYLCDGDYDCSDRSDEADCSNPLPCEPNEFQCNNGKCAMKIWRCDGDDDCGDGSDEISCPTSDPNAPCQADEYQCLAGNQCIPASYQCDGEIDCQDRSDEIGCASPTVIRPPPPTAQAQQGQTITIECEAIGVPTPIIVWRLNWGHVGKPPRVSSTSEGGRGVLTIRNARAEDEGAYTCEALNNKGSIFAQPDTILTIILPSGICTPPFFNAEAGTRDECIRCFCYDQTTDCVSSSHYKSEISAGNSLDLVSRSSRQPLGATFVQYIPRSNEFSIQDYSRRVQGEYYWSMPIQFLENKITSYGSRLAYTITYQVDGSPSRPSGPDVIMAGKNGQMVYHTSLRSAFAGVTQNVDIPLREGSWTTDEQGVRPVDRPALMRILADIDYIMVKSNYDPYQREVRIGDIRMGVSVPQDAGIGRAVLVEQCSCPTGYSGTSCEVCAPGFQKNPSTGRCQGCNCNGHSNDCDPLSGRCRNCQHNTEGDDCGRCIRGFYGDARQGTASDCIPCPCPLTSPGNQFTRDCYLEVDGEVTCRNCPPEFTGRRCERCAPGYQGNPQVIGDTCRPVGQPPGRCDPRGSYSPEPNPRTGRCDCKRYVEGPYCDQCSRDTFHLSADNPNGCIACFCSGVTSSCSSTSWNRAQLFVQFNGDTQGFKIADATFIDTVDRGITVDPRSRTISYRDFQSLRGNSYYWSLPKKFLGDKVSSYGGKLRYTIEYTPGFDTTPNTDHDVEISGNDIVLQHRHGVTTAARQPISFQVAFTEDKWVRQNGAPATREHLMMALSDLEYIMIKNTYTISTVDSTISDVSMDIAESRNTGLGRALEVEECRCPRGYRGLSCEQCDHNTAGVSCERCAPGYYGDPTRGTPTDCQPCPCPLTSPPNQFSPTCELADDGQVTCIECPQGYTGRRCERCDRGYEGDPLRPGGSCRLQGSQPSPLCTCDPRGTVDCDQVTRQCRCKEHVTGVQCNECKRGYYGLSQDNPVGCSQCYCMGHSTECTSSNYYVDQIKPVWNPDGSHNFVLTDRRLSQQIRDGFRVNAANNEITFNRFSDVQRPDDRTALFFELPPSFRGGLVTSYGGLLKFTLQVSVAQDFGEEFRDVDIEIMSGERRLYYLFNPPLRLEEPNRYEIRMDESNWASYDANQLTRETFMAALAKVDAILIRATYHTQMAYATLRGLNLDTAVPQNTGQGVASWLEDCTCPPQYTGLSCQECRSGFSRSPDPAYPLGICTGCNCNGHAVSCDPVTQQCLQCQHNTVGSRCERCAPGYYGDPSVGTANDCRPCECPLSIPSNQFSRTCYLELDGRPTCDACEPGYEGRDCGRCAAGYSGNPRQPGGRCVRGTGPEPQLPTINISVRRMTETIGATITIRVDIRAAGPFNVDWTRKDGRPLPDRAQITQDYWLVIPDATPEDSGIYVITVVSSLGTSVDEVKVTVLGDQDIRVFIQEPKAYTASVGETVRFTCVGIYPQVSYPDQTYILAWTKDGGRMGARVIDDGQGGLVFTSVTPEDAGTYTCTGSTFDGVDTDKAVLSVGGASEPPVVRIEPRYLQVSVGDPVEFRCIASGMPLPRLEWTRDGGNLSPESSFENGVFRIPYVRKSDEAQYTCRASNSAGSAEVQTIIYVSGNPEPEPEPEPTPGPGPQIQVNVGQRQLVVPVGAEASLSCQVSTPGVTVVDIRWSRVGGQLPYGSSQRDGVLTIRNVDESARGRYQCTITIAAGVSGTGFVDLQVSSSPTRNEAPTVTMDPERQTVGTGQTTTVRCIVTGSPQPVITWSRQGGELDDNFQVEGNVLRITRTRMEDRDLYICTAENAAGTARGAAIVDVERRELPRIELYPEESVTIETGGSALFQCRVAGGSPTPTIVWSRANNAQFTQNTEVMDENGVLRFNGVSGPEAGGYICTASNAMGTVTATATLNIRGGRLGVQISQPSPLRVREGQRVSFECTASVPSANVYWQQPPSRREPAGSATTGGSAMIDIFSVQQSDAGRYTCVADSGADRATDILELVVEGGTSGGGGVPTVQVQQTEYVVSPGQSARFVCTAAGSPPPRITWTRRGAALPANHVVSDGILDIPRVSPEDAGEYVCTGRNAAGSFDVVVYLRVQAALAVDVSPASQTISVGQGGQDRIILDCRVRGNVPAQYEWTKVDGPLSQSAVIRGGQLYITPVTAADAGRYRCVAITTAGTAEAYSQIIVSVAPSATIGPRSETVGVGQSVQFTCQATGSPQPRITWSREGAQLPDQHTVQNGVLTIYNAQPGDEGRYICTVQNEISTVRDTCFLRVQGGVVPPPEVQEQRQTVALGDRVEMNCQVTGSPPPTVRWERVGQALPRSAQVVGNLLVIPAVEAQDGGTYRCVASNIAGSVFAQIVLLIEAKPTILVERQSRTASVGSQVTLTCEATGSPPPTISWSKRGGRLPYNHQVSGGVLTIPALAAEDTGEYVCTAQNRFGSAQAIVDLQIGDFVPYFTQNPTSYISYDTLQDAYVDFDVEVSFIPHVTDGLLLYNGELTNGNGDFMGVAMRDGRVEFKFDVGSGPASIVSDPVQLNEWHTIRVKRNDRNGQLYVGGNEYRGVAPGTFRGLDLREDFYVGGVPDYSRISTASGYRQGFVGGVSNIDISGRKLNLGGAMKQSVGVTEYPVCRDRPCRNGGQCGPASTPVGYQCLCPSGYSGQNCELTGERCYQGACGQRGLCLDLPGGQGYRCTCPVGLTGARCERGLSINTPSFNRTSFIAYQTIPSANEQVQISMMFKPRRLTDSLLLYNAFSNDGNGDYIALALKDQFVEFRYDSGSGPAIIRSDQRVREGEWTTIMAERNQRDGSLSVNGGVAVKGQSPYDYYDYRGQSEGNTVGLNLRGNMYIGGVDIAQVRVAPGVEVDAGFQGCISEVVVKGQAVDLVNSAASSANIADCEDNDPCSRRPCSNGGLCEQISQTDYACRCPPEFTGRNCETAVTICTTRNPCRNGGLCRAEGRQGFNCLCPIGYAGTVCDTNVRIGDSVQFAKFGYIELPNQLLPHISSNSEEELRLTVETTRPHGLLIYQGQEPTETGRGQDYVAIALHSGYVSFSYELGTGPANITSRTRVDDGRPHKITAIRTGKAGQLIIDDVDRVEGRSRGNLQSLNTKGNIYLGGIPDPETMTSNRYDQTLAGCIREVYIQQEGPLNLGLEAVGGLNVEPCDSFK